MSGLVFVQDAQGRPLMPTSAAYARTLLHKRKARRISHPAFNIIQLTSVIPKPVLRPVVASIFLHHQTASLVLLTEHLRGTISSLSMIVDLTTDSRTHLIRRIGWRPRAYARHASTSNQTFVHQSWAPNVSMLSVRKQMRMLATLIAGLQVTIPMSHFSVFTTPPGRPASSHMSRYIEIWLMRYLHQFSVPINLVRPADLQATLSAELAHSVQRVGTATDKPYPNLIMCFLDVSTLHRTFSLPGKRPLSDGKQPTRAIQPGQVCSFQHLGRTRTGIVGDVYRDSIIVRVAADATSSRIHWRRIRVHRHQIRQLWPVSSILMLPLARLSTSPELV